MNQHHAHHGSKHVKPGVQVERVEPRLQRVTEKPNRQHDQSHANDQGVKDLPSRVELQFLPVPRTYTGNTGKQERGKFAARDVAVIVDYPPLDTTVYVTEYTAPVVKHGGGNSILEELQQDGNINNRAKYLVKTL